MSASFQDSIQHPQTTDTPELTVPTIPGPSNGSSTFLEVLTTTQPRRPSVASVLSDFSELSYLASDQTGLVRHTSNSSHVSATSTSIRGKLHDLYLQNYGVLLVLLSQLFGSGMNVATRLLEQPGPHGQPMHPFQILFTRQSLTALFCTLYAVTTKSIPHFPLGPPGREIRLLLVSRGLCGFFGVFGLYFSLLYLPLSEATVLTFLAPILTCYACSILIPGETFTRQQQMAGLVSLLGVVFIAQPFSLLSPAPSPSSPSPHGASNTTAAESAESSVPAEGPTIPTPSQHLLAIGIAMIGVVGATGALTSIRAIGTRVHAFISINYFSVWSSIVSLAALVIFPDVSFRLPGNLMEWGLLLSLGVCGFILQALLTMGLAYGGPATTITKTVQPERQDPDGTIRSGDDIEMQNTAGLSSKSKPSRSGRRLESHKPKPPSKPKGSGTRATSMLYMQMLFALLADRIVFDSVPGAWSWIGSGLILTGAIWVAVAKDTRSDTKGRGQGQHAGRTERSGESPDSHREDAVVDNDDDDSRHQYHSQGIRFKGEGANITVQQPGRRESNVEEQEGLLASE